MADYFVDQTDEWKMVVLQKIWERIQKDGQTTAVAFISHAEIRKGPESAMLSFFIDTTLEAVYNNDNLATMMINPWGDEFFLSKPMLHLILNQKGILL